MAEKLSDAELRKQLLALGVTNIGPFTSSTRQLYVKKLNSLQGNVRSASRQGGTAEPSSKMAEELTDAELRRQLVELGEDVGPITPATRSVYVKKLNKAKAGNKNSSNSRASLPDRKLIGFSSDESDDDGAASRGRAKTASAGRKAKSTSRTAAAKKNHVAPASRGRRRRAVIENDHDDVEEEDDDEDDGEAAQMRSFSVQASMHDSRSYIEPSSMTFDEDMDFDAADGFQSSDTDGECQEAYTRRSPMSAPKTSPKSNDTSYYNNRSSAFSHNTSKDSVGARLRSSRSNVVPSSRMFHGGSSTASNNLARGSKVNTDLNTSNEAKIQDYGFKTKEEPSSKCAQYISMVLVLCVVVFFVLLAVVYITNGIHPGLSTSNDTWLLCSAGTLDTCYTAEEIETAKPLLYEIFLLLNGRAIQHICHKEGDSAGMSRDEIISGLRRKFDRAIGGSGSGNSLDIALNLIAHNPQWNIVLHDSQGEETKEVKDISSLVTTAKALPWMCRLEQSAMKVFTTAAIVFGVIVAGLIILMCLRHRWRQQKKEKQQIYDYVEKIVDMLKTKSDEDGTDAFMAIPHVRDQLIPLKDRRKKQPLWDKAVKFLSAHESRIREETQKIHGEEFLCWRWIQSTPNGKVWQGKAFNDNLNNARNMPYSLTQCLKVRNMFDADVECEENWDVRIQDAILEKCGDRHNIVHIAVDKMSREGCVYIKCVDGKAAGNAYQALHGWWFDGKLVTVKYLRLERYHERFPDAQAASRPLTPSNNDCLSLSQPFHQSIIETS